MVAVVLKVFCVCACMLVCGQVGERAADTASNLVNVFENAYVYRILSCKVTHIHSWVISSPHLSLSCVIPSYECICLATHRTWNMRNTELPHRSVQPTETHQ